MALTTVIGNTILIVLDEENVERIQAHDPFELDMRKMGTVTLGVPFRIVIAYASKEEQPKIAELAKGGLVSKHLLEYLYRGFKITRSDHDRGYDKYDKLK